MSFLETVESSARLGNQYVWKINIDLPDSEGEGYALGGRLIYLRVGDKVGNEALKHLKGYDRFAYAFEIYAGNIPETQSIDISSIIAEDISPKYGNLKISVLRGNFVDILKDLESSKFTGMSFFRDINNNELVAVYNGGRLCGIRYISGVGNILRILEENKKNSTEFYIMEFPHVNYVVGYMEGSKVFVDVPAGMWSVDKIKKFKGVVEVSRGLGIIMIISDGNEILTMFRLGVPPVFDESLSFGLFKRGNLINAYLEGNPRFIFKFSFSEAQKVVSLFSRLVSESRRIIGEMVFKRAADKVLNYSLPTKPYPDETVETLKNIFKLYEREISAFTGRRWKEIKTSILKDYPENISSLF